MRYDQLTRDLARKAGDDAVAATYRTMALHSEPGAQIVIATMAAGQVLGLAVGAMAARFEADADSVADTLWEHIRPLLVDSARRTIRVVGP